MLKGMVMVGNVTTAIGGLMNVEYPTNTYLDYSGADWKCFRGFQKINGACSKVNIPANAYLTLPIGTRYYFREALINCLFRVIRISKRKSR